LSVILLFATPVVIVIAILVHRTMRTKRIHETVVKLAEKGLPIPPDLFVDKPAEDKGSALQKASCWSRSASACRFSSSRFRIDRRRGASA
jgi:hypothetical protein